MALSRCLRPTASQNTSNSKQPETLLDEGAVGTENHKSGHVKGLDKGIANIIGNGTSTSSGITPNINIKLIASGFMFEMELFILKRSES